MAVPPSEMLQLADLLDSLYKRQMEQCPDDSYLQEHSRLQFRLGTVRTFQFYRPYLPKSGIFLDWGCRHTPDSCLLRLCFGPAIELHGCDVEAKDRYAVFSEYSRLRYERLSHPFWLPYPDGKFDAVIASGVLEHVPMDYESMKELYRVLKSGGRLIITYLPSSWSVEEQLLRLRGGPHHARLYSPTSLRKLLLHTGFRPIVLGFQTQLDALPAEDPGLRGIRPVLRCLGLHRLTACLCAVAEKVCSY